jgi:hypothetical protein
MLGIKMKMPSNCGECPLLEKCNNPRHPFVICKASVQPKEISLFNVINDVQINCPLVPAVSLERIKETREKISDWDVNKLMDGCSEPFRLGVARGLDIASVILDKLIAESEGKGE